MGISETWDVEWGEWKLARNGRGKVERGNVLSVIRSERAFIVPSVNTSGTVGRGGRDGLSLIVPTVWLTSR